MRQINKIILHHSRTDGGDKGLIRHIHVDKNKWKSIGYHFIICNGLPQEWWEHGKDGEIQIGRSIELTGSHTKGGNRASIGICLIGDFEKKEPTRAQLASLVGLLGALCIKFKLSPRKSIYVHSDICTTECPGEMFRDLIPTIILFTYLNKIFQRVWRMFTLKKKI